MSRNIGYIVLLISICASGAFARSLKCAKPECPAVDPDASYESTLLPYPYDCSKFIICDHGNPIIENCQAGLHFNPTALYCDWPVNAGCVACEDGTTTEEPMTTTEEPITSTEAPTTTEEPITSTEAPTTTEEPTTEAPTTEAPTTEAPTTEAPTTEAPTTTEEPTTEKPTTEEPTTEKPTTEEPITTQAPEPKCEIEACPKLDDNSFLFLAVPWDCSKYVMCLNDYIYDMNCASGLIFSYEAQNCVIPSETEVCDPCELEVESTTTLEPEVTPPPCKVEECLRTQNTPLYLAVPWDCSKLILCIRGQTFEQTCGDGLIFSPAGQNCVRPEDAVCEVCDQATKEPEVTEPATEATEVTEPATETTEVTEPATETTEVTEPATETTEVTEPATEATDAPTSTEPATETPVEPEQCTTGNPSCSFLALNVLSPVPWNCSQYFSCSWGSLSTKTCEENTYFETATSTCVTESSCVACRQ